jgi:hypothetical protein
MWRRCGAAGQAAAMEPTICTVFSIRGDANFVPEELKRAIGLEPTKSYRLGEINRRSGRPWKESCWSLQLGPDPSLDHGGQVERLVTLIEPVMPILDRFCARLTVEKVLKLSWAGVDETQSNPYITLSPPLLSRISSIGAAIEIAV